MKAPIDPNHPLSALWEQLQKVSTLTIVATELQEEGEVTKRAQGHVAIETPDARTLIFREQGQWFVGERREISFSNSYKWTLDSSSLAIRLEHLRYGDQHPVFLFNLIPTSSGCLKAQEAHLCNQDTYLGHVNYSLQVIDLHIRVIGPAKNTRLLYSYS